jgi:uncharacterized damage-inducible protein DinB
MYRTIVEFVDDWTAESAISLKVERALTDAALPQQIYPEGRTLGQLAWHMVLMIGMTGSIVGLEVEAPPRGAKQPGSAAAIADAYQTAARSMGEQASARLKDAQLSSDIAFFGRSLPMSRVLYALIVHQVHHRGQMTVLMRQAGLVPPGVYGPTREEGAAIRAKQEGKQAG